MGFLLCNCALLCLIATAKTAAAEVVVVPMIGAEHRFTFFYTTSVATSFCTLNIHLALQFSRFSQSVVWQEFQLCCRSCRRQAAAAALQYKLHKCAAICCCCCCFCLLSFPFFLLLTVVFPARLALAISSSQSTQRLFSVAFVTGSTLFAMAVTTTTTTTTTAATIFGFLFLVFFWWPTHSDYCRCVHVCCVCERFCPRFAAFALVVVVDFSACRLFVSSTPNSGVCSLNSIFASTFVCALPSPPSFTPMQTSQSI